METLLSRFCDEFGRVVQPMLDPLEFSVETLGGSNEHLKVREILPGLRDTAHQLRALADKVAEQQAYVLIFGPLKSGKSTLMNAMCAAYVSEVTTLPAYPCMVFVSHSEERQLEALRYNGTREKFADAANLRMALNRAHAELADRLRRSEEEDGQEFDPALHLPEAIRRVDVKIPAGQLAESGAVLVDTPGLYTKMHFGYDRMTREFRNAAACAIFVVKTDNLFLEQVFSEFNRLLQLFSRIFLVVNLDTAKKDLRPDGSLVPSLEHDDPIRIVEAFETLAMSAQLKDALEAGRLKIYPVDLQQAAATRLSRGSQPYAADHEHQADFDSFLKDLTDYLNSTDYLVAFLGDSLRHGETLLAEAAQLCGKESVRELGELVDSLQAEMERERALAQRLTALDAQDWEEAYSGLGRDIGADIEAQALDIRVRASHAEAGVLDSWFASDDSLQDLAETEIAGLREGIQNEIAGAAREALRVRSAGGAAVAALTVDTRAALDGAGLRLDSIAREAADRVDAYAGVQREVPPIDVADIPVRKRILDWLLFRGQASVRRKLFGAPGELDRRIPRAIKAKRLGEPAKRALHGLLRGDLEAFLPAAEDRIVERICADYAASMGRGLHAEVDRRRQTNERRIAQLRTELGQLRSVRDSLTEVGQGAANALGEIRELAGRYETTAPERLLTAQAAPVPEIEPADETSEAAPENRPV
ncbi:MAG TPA: dynamin family protein [Planctomycetota bacterium]